MLTFSFVNLFERIKENFFLVTFPILDFHDKQKWFSLIDEICAMLIVEPSKTTSVF